MTGSATDSLRARLMEVVPDEPVWIEARAVLLDAQSRLFGTPGAFVIRSDSWRLAAIGGDASASLIHQALSDIPDSGSDPTALWVAVIPAGFTGEARQALAAWSPEEADVGRVRGMARRADAKARHEGGVGSALRERGLQAPRGEVGIRAQWPPLPVRESGFLSRLYCLIKPACQL